VVKNEIKIGKLAAQYDKTREEIEDLMDSWTQSLRRKKKVKRKDVKVNTKGDATAIERCGMRLMHRGKFANMSPCSPFVCLHLSGAFEIAVGTTGLCMFSMGRAWCVALALMGALACASCSTRTSGTSA
jgi:hypothetical protein